MCAYAGHGPGLGRGSHDHTRLLVPTREHCRALESVQLKATRMILRCPPRTSSDVTRADMGLQLLSSRKHIAKLKRQHRLHGLPADRLETCACLAVHLE